MSAVTFLDWLGWLRELAGRPLWHWGTNAYSLATVVGIALSIWGAHRLALLTEGRVVYPWLDARGLDAGVVYATRSFTYFGLLAVGISVGLSLVLVAVVGSDHHLGQPGHWDHARRDYAPRKPPRHDRRLWAT